MNVGFKIDSSDFSYVALLGVFWASWSMFEGILGHLGTVWVQVDGDLALFL